MTSLTTPTSNATPGPFAQVPTPHGREKLSIANSLRLYAVWFCVFAALAIPFGLVTGVLTWAPSADRIWLTAAIALILPATLEEAVFRGPLLRWQHPVLIIGLWIGYLGWHLLAAATFLPAGAHLFFDPAFLVIVGLFGSIATYLTLRTGRVLPSILFHWAMVVAWKQLFSGPIIMGAV